MTHAAYVGIIDKLLRDVMGNDVPFGGKVVVAAGDFRQTAPVVPRASRTTISAASPKSHHLWRRFQAMQLTVPVRAATDPQFAAFLETVGNGTALFVDRLTGRPLPDGQQRQLQQYGGQHFIRIPPQLLPRLRVFTDPQEALQWVHPPTN